MLRTKLTDSMEKCFPDQRPEEFPLYQECHALSGMQVSFQMIYWESDSAIRATEWLSLKVSGDLAPYVRVRRVECVPSSMPIYPNRVDRGFLRTTPGLYPDLLLPLQHDNSILITAGQSRSLWVDVLLPASGLKKGKHSVTLSVSRGETTIAEETFTVFLSEQVYHPSDYPVTQWFHTDCLADYYGVKIFSEKYWEIVENFIRTAVSNRINTILTPIFTPPLDTHEGGERPTVQLVDVEKNGEEYRFSYRNLDRWLELCLRNGVRYFEISHLFTQWGAEHAPKIVANVNGKKKRIFGWNTDATGEEYRAFLSAFLPDFVAHMKEKKLDKLCFFHISDEPNPEQLEHYRMAKELVKKYLDGYVMMDALSDYAYYRDGLVETPIVDTGAMGEFLKNKVPNTWAYYCCGIHEGVSNRLFAMPGWRTRSLGYQMYHCHANGFLQWGYNFYYNQGSYDLVNPYQDSTGNGFSPSGDCYSVYPAPNGTAYESMRILQFRAGLEDRDLLEAVERRYGRRKAEAVLKKNVGNADYFHCATASEPILSLREELIELLAKK